MRRFLLALVAATLPWSIACDSVAPLRVDLPGVKHVADYTSSEVSIGTYAVTGSVAEVGPSLAKLALPCSPTAAQTSWRESQLADDPDWCVTNMRKLLKQHAPSTLPDKRTVHLKVCCDDPTPPHEVVRLYGVITTEDKKVITVAYGRPWNRGK